MEAVRGGECGLPLISFFDTDVVVPPSYVHLREVLHSFQFVNEGGNEWKWICVLDCLFIEVSIVLARTESSVLFLYEKEWRGLGGL